MEGALCAELPHGTSLALLLTAVEVSLFLCFGSIVVSVKWITSAGSSMTVTLKMELLGASRVRPCEHSGSSPADVCWISVYASDLPLSAWPVSLFGDLGAFLPRCCWWYFLCS